MVEFKFKCEVVS